MKVQQFTGGLSTRLRPQFLALTRAAEYVNIDNSKGTLIGDKGSLLTALDLEQYMFFFEEEGVWLSETNPTIFVEYQGSVYSADGIAPHRYKAGNKYKLGIDAPTTNSWAPTTGSDPAAKMDGTYNYVLTFYDQVSGIESGPTEPTADFTVGPTGQVSFSSLPVSTDPQVTHKRLYRIGGTGTVFTLVAEILNASIYYIDRAADTELQAVALQTSTYKPAPTGLTYIAEYNGMLFGCLGPRLYFTPVGLPGSWSEFNYFTYARNVVGCAKTPNGLVVLTETEAYAVTGQTHTTLRSKLIDSEQGCVAKESIQLFGTTAVWVSRQGICASAGGDTQVLSMDALGVKQFSPRSSAVRDKVYYLLDSSGIMLAMDGRFELIFKHFDLGISHIAAAVDGLYGWTNDNVYKLFSSDERLSWTYKSPKFIEGKASELKAYKKFYVYSEGTVNIKILIDDDEAFNGTLIGKGQHELQVPTDKQRGQYVQFELNGTGEVYELEYQVQGAER